MKPSEADGVQCHGQGVASLGQPRASDAGRLGAAGAGFACSATQGGNVKKEEEDGKGEALSGKDELECRRERRSRRKYRSPHREELGRSGLTKFVVERFCF